jgi:hypothetical protein
MRDECRHVTLSQSVEGTVRGKGREGVRGGENEESETVE